MVQQSKVCLYFKVVVSLIISLEIIWLNWENLPAEHFSYCSDASCEVEKDSYKAVSAYLYIECDVSEVKNWCPLLVQPPHNVCRGLQVAVSDEWTHLSTRDVSVMLSL